MKLGKLYGTDLHWRGASLPGVGVKYLPRERLAVLHPDEQGQLEFTLEGWLQQIGQK